MSAPQAVRHTHTADAPLMVRLEGVTKVFRVGRPPTAFGWLRRQWSDADDHHRLVPALDNLSLDIGKGERLGLIGNNGAGKTTLLRTIAGLYRPSRGRVEVTGDITLLAGLGLGMVDELTVAENIFLYGAIHGLDRAHIAAVRGDILEWAGLEEFADAKLRALSTGMATRLAFSVTRHVEKSVYLLDEALTAGDRTFTEKCGLVFEQFKATDKTFVVSTHSMTFVKSFCTSVLWLDRGRRMALGSPADVVALYERWTGGGDR
jgi:ABC-type polysaccharide/polyol phosphate transport system ATPase subunit